MSSAKNLINLENLFLSTKESIGYRIYFKSSEGYHIITVIIFIRNLAPQQGRTYQNKVQPM